MGWMENERALVVEDRRRAKVFELWISESRRRVPEGASREQAERVVRAVFPCMSLANVEIVARKVSR